MLLITKLIYSKCGAPKCQLASQLVKIVRIWKTCKIFNQWKNKLTDTPRLTPFNEKAVNEHQNRTKAFNSGGKPWNLNFWNLGYTFIKYLTRIQNSNEWRLWCFGIAVRNFLLPSTLSFIKLCVDKFQLPLTVKNYEFSVLLWVIIIITLPPVNLDMSKMATSRRS